ncbi:hypothetical protein F4604DRAFT_1673312 [Suillus subluteus]|nr:hypothetical protein F4604DRAFT_1673312 [Suillus subluteus]
MRNRTRGRIRGWEMGETGNTGEWVNGKIGETGEQDMWDMGYMRWEMRELENRRREMRELETGDGRWETGDGRRETGDGRRETGDGRRETGDGRRETGDGRRETGDGRRETGDGRRETGDGRRETGDGRRETGDGRRETGDGRRETGDGRRETGDGRREDGGQGKWMQPGSLRNGVDEAHQFPVQLAVDSNMTNVPQAPPKGVLRTPLPHCTEGTFRIVESDGTACRRSVRHAGLHSASNCYCDGPHYEEETIVEVLQELGHHKNQSRRNTIPKAAGK